MKGICVGKGIVIGMKFAGGSFGCETMCNSAYNTTAERQRSFSSFIAWDIACRSMR